MIMAVSDIPQGQGCPSGLDNKDIYIRRRWKQVQYLADLFWKRWSREYLITLQKRQKWLNLRKNVQINDIILIMEDNLPRNQWCMGKIEEIFRDQDDLIRKVKIKTKNSILERPIHKTVTILEADSN